MRDNISSKKKIILLGMMSKIPVAGAVWGAVQYLIGLQRLGYDVYYVEAHARTPSMLMQSPGDDGSALAAAFIGRVMRRFGLDEKWAFHALHDDGRCFGMTHSQLQELYRSADLIINYHGGTVPRSEHRASGRLVFLETDPVQLEIKLYHNNPAAIALLEPHAAFFSWGANYGQPDCLVPLPARFEFQPTLPVVVQDLWQSVGGLNGNGKVGSLLTTVGNWRQEGEVRYQGEVYAWSKHLEYLKFLDLPRRTSQGLELALSSYTAEDRQLLESHGWRVRDALDFSSDLDTYRDYVLHSRGEFTVAKDQNVRLRSGWFSERSAQYLAAGRPVITQDTGFSNVIPTGRGLFGFRTMDDILAALDAINSDYQTQSRAAAELAREYFNYDVVLPRMLHQLGV